IKPPEAIAPPTMPPLPDRVPTELGPTPRRATDVPPPGQEPLPIFQAPAPGPYDVNEPKMPPYAWPTYAPYNNYSRVAYPQQYPSAAFPFIGPFYPFPKVPLGYRAIKLEWEDGHWFYGRTAVKHDFWTVRYW